MSSDSQSYAEQQMIKEELTSALVTVLSEKPADAKARMVELLSGKTTSTMPEIKAYYTAPFAPNPMLVDIFAREKGIILDSKEVAVDILGAKNREGDSLKKNPAGQVPYFELEDGTVVAETITMMEYLEELQPSPSLIGATAVERAQTRMWQRRMEEHFVYPTFTGFRFWTASDDCEGDFKGFFNGKAPVLVGSAWKEMRTWALSQLKWLEAQKKENPSDFIVGDSITYVDIQVFTTLKFFAVPGHGDFLVDNKDELPWVVAFFDRMMARDSVKACFAHIAGN